MRNTIVIETCSKKVVCINYFLNFGCFINFCTRIVGIFPGIVRKLHNAPLPVLQIYILIKDPYANRINSTQLVDEGVDPYLKLIILVLSVASSLVSLAWSLVVYHRSLR